MLLAFLVVFGILAKYGFPAITNMVDERNRYIDESLRKAHEAQERLANIEKEGESILQEAREKQAQILKEAAETRDAIVEQAQAKARSEGARLLDEAKMAIEQEKKAAIADIRQQVATLSVDIAEKVLRKNLKDDKSQMDLIDRMLDEVSVGTITSGQSVIIRARNDESRTNPADTDVSCGLGKSFLRGMHHSAEMIAHQRDDQRENHRDQSKETDAPADHGTTFPSAAFPYPLAEKNGCAHRETGHEICDGHHHLRAGRNR